MRSDYQVPDDLLYTEEHEWVRRDPDRVGEAEIGITDFAQDSLGDVVFVDLPAEGQAISGGEPCGEIESTKTASELYAPVDGVVTAVNSELEDLPELVNDAPYGEGWMLRVRIDDPTQLDGLLSAAAYHSLVEEG